MSSVARHLPMPIIVGAPRSGTTLLRFMLDSHPELAIPPETGFLAIPDSSIGTNRSFFSAITEYPPEAPAWADFGITFDEFHAALAEIEPFCATEGFRAFYKLYAAKQGKSRWGDKTPSNGFHLRQIRAVLPEAHFIHIVRDGRDACLSWRQTWFSPGQDIKFLASQWQRWVVAARTEGQRHPPYLEVRYEDLVESTDQVLMAIARFLELDFDPAMLRYYEQTPDRLREHRSRSWVNGSRLVTHQQRLDQQRLTMQPPDRNRLAVWQREMCLAEQAEFCSVAGDTLQGLGYRLGTGAAEYDLPSRL